VISVGRGFGRGKVGRLKLGGSDGNLLDQPVKPHIDLAVSLSQGLDQSLKLVEACLLGTDLCLKLLRLLGQLGALAFELLDLGRRLSERKAAMQEQG